MDGNGTIFITNSLGLSIEAVRGNKIQKVLGQINPDADGINRYNDLAFDNSGGLLIIDSDSSTILRLNLATGEVKKIADGPTVDKGLFYISSLDYREGKMLVAGVPFMKVAAAANVKTGPSKAFEFDGTSWHEVLDADAAAGVSVSQIREIHCAKDGGFTAIVGKLFVSISPKGIIRRVATGKKLWRWYC